MRLTLSAIALALGLLLPALAGNPAAAGSIFVSEVSFSNGYAVSTIHGGAVSSTPSYYAGQFTLTANAGTTNNPAGHYRIYAWCVDILHAISLGQTGLVYDLGSLTTAGYGGPSLSADQQAQIGWLAAYGNAELSKGPDSLLSAAVQTAIWNVANGSSYVGANVPLGQAVTSLMAEAKAHPTGFTMTTLLPVAGRDGTFSQMLVTAEMAPVPEPASLGLLGLGLVGLIAARRRLGETAS